MPHWDSGIRAKSVVYIHGIGNKPPEAELKLQWDHALYTWDLREESTMAYWADIRYPNPIGSNDSEGVIAPDEQPPIALNGSLSLDEVVASTLSALPLGDVEDVDAASAFSSAYLRELVSTESLRATVDVESIDPTSPIPGFIRQPGFWLATKLFIPDAHAYFFNSNQRQQIQERLRTRLRTAHKPVLLLAHSLGSIIAYDILHEEAMADLDLAAFITFGSQLGVQAIQDRVRRPLEVPTSARACWHNYLDKKDVLPMGKTLNAFYRPHVIEDQWAENPSPNDHDGVSYLSENRLQEAAYRAFPGPAPTGLGRPLT